MATLHRLPGDCPGRPPPARSAAGHAQTPGRRPPAGPGPGPDRPHHPRTADPRSRCTRACPGRGPSPTPRQRPHAPPSAPSRRARCTPTRTGSENRPAPQIGDHLDHPGGQRRRDHRPTPYARYSAGRPSPDALAVDRPAEHDRHRLHACAATQPTHPTPRSRSAPKTLPCRHGSASPPPATAPSSTPPATEFLTPRRALAPQQLVPQQPDRIRQPQPRHRRGIPSDIRPP